ncbi:MAG: ABC transporter permease [Myxococcota bacterium]
MKLPFEVEVAFRYLQARRKAGISLTSFLTIAGVGLGVAALTVVTSVWNGFEREFLEKLLGVNAHAVVLRRFDVFRDHVPKAEQLRAHPRVLEVSPIVYSEVIVQSARGVQGVAIKGVDPDRVVNLPLADYIARTGTVASTVLDRLRSEESEREGDETPGMIIGHGLQEVLHVEPGELVTIISPYGGKGGRARTKQFEIAGVFRSGMFEFDSRMVFIGLEPAQSFFQLYDTVTGLEVWTEDPISSQTTVHEALADISDIDMLAYEVKDWSVTNRSVFGAVNQQKAVISLVLSFIVLVAAFNIMATLFLLILEKRREIAILKSLGASRRSILGIFVLDGQLIGLTGCISGLALGLVVCGLIGRYGLRLDPRVYYVENMPIVVNPLEIGLIVGGAMVLATAATLLPAWTAARLDPVAGLTQRMGQRRPAAAPDAEAQPDSGMAR